MDTLNTFSIPIKGLYVGIHTFEFELDDAFFAAFEGSIIQRGQFHVVLEFDKRSNMSVLNFDIKGYMHTACDRCLEDIRLPVETQTQLLLKLAETPSEEAEVVYITDTLSAFNVAKYIYEYVHLAVPIVKIYDCEAETPRPCNDQLLDYLEQKEDTDENEINPVWDELKKLKNNK